MATLTVKGTRASAEQIANIVLLCKIGKQMGATLPQLAGALATMMQESNCQNIKGGDRDSAGLFQQRPSMGWGTYAQVTDPDYAIRKFLTPYLSYCRKGQSPISASNSVQRSAYPTAPAQWLSESTKDVGVVTQGKDFVDVTTGGTKTNVATGGTTQTVVRTEPYEFSRGTPNQPETSWDCLGRLATEVNWSRFMRGGQLWFVSSQWLSQQRPRFVFATGVQGVVSIAFSNDSRRNAAECTVTAVALRWSVLPGDVVTVKDQGPANGNWLVASTRRTLAAATTEITLKRPAPKLPEPAPQQDTTTVNVAGKTDYTLSSANLKGATNQAARAYYFADIMSRWHIPYSINHRTLVDHPPDADCSSSCSWVLWKAGFPLPGNKQHAGAWAPVSGEFESWGAAGFGKYMTIMCNAEHIWIRWNGIGPAWRFDTSPHNSGPNGPQQRTGPRSEDGFMQRHWPGL